MYFITTLKVLEKNIVDDCRTIGYFSSYGKAYDYCMNNIYDMFEGGYYNYAVITYIEEGIYSRQVEQQWFSCIQGKTIIAIAQYHKKPDIVEDYTPYIIG